MAVTFKIKDFGWLKFELHCNETPNISTNFLQLCASGYYDNTLFHRNIRGFILQGGDPTATGKGGESATGEFLKDEIHPDLKHSQRGVLSMANNGKDKSQGAIETKNTNKCVLIVNVLEQILNESN